MAKKITGYVKLQVPAGAANPSPPIGPALGQRGLNIMEFCKAFNARTAQMEKGTPIPVVITAFQDRWSSNQTGYRRPWFRGHDHESADSRDCREKNARSQLCLDRIGGAND